MDMCIKKKGLFLIFLCVMIKYSTGQDSLNNEVDRFFAALEKKQQSLLYTAFPDVTIDGESFRETTLKGKITLINFWFAGCKPCLLEFNALDRLVKKLKSTREFQIISMTYENRETIDELKKKFTMGFRITTIPQPEFNSLLQGTGCPINVILDKNGIIKFWKSGGEASEEKLNVFFENTIYPAILKELSK